MTTTTTPSRKNRRPRLLSHSGQINAGTRREFRFHTRRSGTGSQSVVEATSTSVEFLRWLNVGGIIATTVSLFVIVFLGGNWWRDINRGKLRKKRPSRCIQRDKNIADLSGGAGRRGVDHGGCFDRAICSRDKEEQKQGLPKDVMQAFTKRSISEYFVSKSASIYPYMSGGY